MLANICMSKPIISFVVIWIDLNLYSVIFLINLETYAETVYVAKLLLMGFLLTIQLFD